MLSPCLFSEKIMTYCLFWGIYDVRLSLTLNSELFRFKNTLIQKKKGWNPLRLPLDLPSAETCFGNLFILTTVTLIALNKTHILLTNLKSKPSSLTKEVLFFQIKVV